MYVYEIVRDDTHETVYVGCTIDPKRRIKEHRRWIKHMPYEADTKVHGPFDTGEDAVTEEQRLITTLNPERNRCGIAKHRMITA